MAHPARPKSPKERRDAKNARILIGREDQQDLFARSLLQPEHREAKLIFSISGQGGVGKTTLLREFERIAVEHGHVTAYVDEGMVTNRVDDAMEALHRLVEDLERQGCRFEEFRKQYKAYRIKKQELEAEPEAPRGLVGDGVRGIMKIGLEAGKGLVPFGGMVDSELVASKMGEMANYGFERFRNRDEERLMRETQEVLTPLFLEGVRKIPIDKTLVLLLDTYEVTGTFLDEWVRALLDEKFGALERSVLVCIAGRSPIDANAWAIWEDWISRSPLEPFTEVQAREFLAGKGILGEAVILEIWRLSSGGLPLLISMMAASAPTSVDAVVDPCESSVERFLKWETDEAKRLMAIDGACARVLNEDVAGAIGDCGFEWLRGCAFVVRDGSRWRYHSVVRDQMVRYQWQRSRSKWSLVHGKLAAFYEGLRSALGLPVGKEAEDQIWREYSLEWIYHTICEAPQASVGVALNGFLMALRESWEFAGGWAVAIVQAGHETRCETLQKYGTYLKTGIVAYEERRFSEAFLALSNLLTEPLIEKKLTAVFFNQRGLWHRGTEQEKLAVQDFQKAIEIDQNRSEYWFSLAEVHQVLRENDIAIEAYKKSIELDPESYKSYNNLGIVYGRKKEIDEAIRAYEKGIKINPNDCYLCLNLGQIYASQKKHEAAILLYEKAIEISPKYCSSYNELGDLYVEQKLYEEAILIYKKLIKVDPKDIQSYRKLGNTYCEQGNYREAILEFKKITSLRLDYKWAFVACGEAYSLMKCYEEALNEFNQALEIDSKYVLAIIKRGWVHRNMANNQNAISDFNLALEINPDSSWALASRGETYCSMEQYEEGLKDFSQAIELDNEYSWALGHRGQAYKILNRYDEALRDFDRAIELEAESSWKLSQRGETYRLMRKYEAALKDFNTAISIESECAPAIGQRGQIFQYLGEFDKSLQDLTQYIDLVPDNNNWCCYLRALTHQKLSTPTEAQADFQTAIAQAQAKQAKDPIDYRNIFNLALYYLAAGNQEESDRLYKCASEASINQIKDAIRDLDDYLILFPGQMQAQEIYDSLSGRLCQRLSGLV